jgi:hypothetical protein
VWRRLGGDDGLEMTIPRVEAANQVEDLTWLGDAVPDRLELIGKAFQLGAVFADGEIALAGAAEFSFKEDGALKFVVEEEPFNSMPKGERGEVGLVDDGEDGLGDGVENPVDDARIGHLPLDVAIVCRSRGADMRREAELGEGGIEEALPLGVVAVFKIKMHRNVVPDVDGLNDGGRGGIRLDVVVGGVRVVGGGRHGCGSSGERVQENFAGH